MPDIAIGDLVAASQIQASDSFVLEQNGTAKKLTGQVLMDWMLANLDGHGGIASISLVSTSGLNKTYRISYADGTSYQYTVTDGRGITNITWTTSGTAGNGQIHTGTITYNDGTTSQIQIRDGVKGDTGTSYYVWIKYASVNPTSDSDMTDIPSDYIGVYTGTSSTAPTSYQSYTWYQYRGESSYVWIKYADNYPISDEEMLDTPSDYIGIYAGNSPTAPTSYEEYTWCHFRGERGYTGAASSLQSTDVMYAVNNGSSIPGSGWQPTVPTVPQGQYLWTRIILTFNSGDPAVFYTVSRSGIDGNGSVSSVNQKSPDVQGDVYIDASDIPYSTRTTAGQLDFLSDFVYKPGDTASGLVVAAFGTVHSSSTLAMINITLPKLVRSSLSSSAITLSSIKPTMYTPDGSIFGSANGSTDLLQYVNTVSVYGNTLRVLLKKTNGWGVSNQIPIIGSARVSFTVN